MDSREAERRRGREEEQTETLSSSSRHVLYCRFTQAARNCSKLVSQRINLSHSLCSFNWFNAIFFFPHCEYGFIREHRSVPPPVSVTVLPWLHHAHCSLQGDIIIWLEREILNPVSVLAGKCIFKNEILNLIQCQPCHFLSSVVL